MWRVEREMQAVEGEESVSAFLVNDDKKASAGTGDERRNTDTPPSTLKKISCPRFLKGRRQSSFYNVFSRNGG